MAKLGSIINKLKSLRPGIRKKDVYAVFKARYVSFKELLSSNTELLDIISEMEQKLQGDQLFGMAYIRSKTARIFFHTYRMVKCLNDLSQNRYAVLYTVLSRVSGSIKEKIEGADEKPFTEKVLPYSGVTRDVVDWVGSKNANLGEIRNRLNIPTPDGFAITSRAFEFYFNTNKLTDRINSVKSAMDPNDPASIANSSREIQAVIMSSAVPPELETAIMEAYDRLSRNYRQVYSCASEPRIAMRSSATGEDTELSYAGQYRSVLNVYRDRIIPAYKDIIASLYTPRAISYRFNKGIQDDHIVMSVACITMVESEASGVMYSRNPFSPNDDHILISAVWGLGPYAVNGTITSDMITVEKDPALTIHEIKIAHKPIQLKSNPDGGMMSVDVAAVRQDTPCLMPQQVRALAGYALTLEEHFRCPQDIEWAIDPKGNLFILQSRPLRVEVYDDGCLTKVSRELSGYDLLIDGGAIAFPGAGFGPAVHINSDEDLKTFPEGGVLVAKHSSPKFVMVMKKASAIITDSGSVLGHMAALVREFSVPTILDAKTATERIRDGMKITVDAYSGRVYQGKVEELLSQKPPEHPYMKGSIALNKLREVADLIIPLHLVDPKSPDFIPQSCKSIHDIMRYVHELSYTEMFGLSDLVSDKGEGSLKLQAHVPLDLYIIDMEGGLERVSEYDRKVKMDQIVSRPLKAFLKGMTHEDFLVHEPKPFHLQGFFSVMTEQMLAPPLNNGERFGDRSYAIISDKYLNFSSRIGYHYSVLDAYCGQKMNKNYITFSFKGGAADEVRRNRRARAIALILEAHHFSVKVEGDRVDARFQKYEQAVIEEKLEAIGRMMQFTRQMDMLMNSEASVQEIATAFLNGNYKLKPDPS